MIQLGEIKFDSADSGPGTLELISEGDQLWIRIHKLGWDTDSFRPLKKRDPEQWKTILLSNRNLRTISDEHAKQLTREVE